MSGLIGRKIGMTQIFTDQGKAVGVTVLEVGPCPVVQVKTEEVDGYEAIQLGFGSRKPRRGPSRAMRPRRAWTTRRRSWPNSSPPRGASTRRVRT